TVKVAGALTASVPTPLLAMARYWLPSWASVVSMVRLSPVVPVGAQLSPPSVDTSHVTVGAGLPDAVTVNVAVSPEVTARLAGFDTIGAVATVRVAAAL